MLVSFSANAQSIQSDIATYRIILDTIRKAGHRIANEWVETASWRSASQLAPEDELRWSAFVRDARARLEAAEVAIIEASGGSSFGTGFEAALALQMKKPCLFLVRKGKEKASYSCGVESEYLTKQTYDQHTLVTIVEEFLKANTFRAKDLRFNFVVDRQIYNHLAKRSYELRKTKAEIVRDLLLRDIQEDQS